MHIIMNCESVSSPRKRINHLDLLFHAMCHGEDMAVVDKGAATLIHDLAFLALQDGRLPWVFPELGAALHEVEILDAT